MKWVISDRREILHIKGLENHLVPTIKGRVRYRDWCIQEAHRINRANGRRGVYVHQDNKGSCWTTSKPWVTIEMYNKGE